jgi:hypothetical protein
MTGLRACPFTAVLVLFAGNVHGCGAAVRDLPPVLAA